MLKSVRGSQIVRNAALCASVVLAVGWSTRVQAQMTLGDPLHFDVTPTEAESLAVTPDGRFILVTGPELLPDPNPDDDVEIEAYTSSIPLLLHLPGKPWPLHELFVTDLGPAEVTDVALHPSGAFAIANIRGDDLADVNQLVLIRGNRVVQRTDLSARMDGIALSPNGRFLVGAVEKGEAVDVYDIQGLGSRMSLVATIGRDAFLPFFAGEESRIQEENPDTGEIEPIDIEPESVTFASDGSLALVTLQEQSSVVVVDMSAIAAAWSAHRTEALDPKEVGAAALANVVHLPFGFLNTRGEVAGVEPDGLSVSPDGAFAVIANEADSRARHLQGISIIDLRGGPANVPEPITWCIFDIDPTLYGGLDPWPSICPEPGEDGAPPENHNDLPRLDPNNTVTVERGGRIITAVNIERSPGGEDRGSVLFLDMTGAVDGQKPTVLDRIPVGLGPGARPEGLKASNGGRFIWVAIQSDEGSIARFELPE